MTYCIFLFLFYYNGVAKEIYQSPWPKEWRVGPAFRPIDTTPLSPHAHTFFPLAAHDFDLIIAKNGVAAGFVEWIDSPDNVEKQMNTISSVAWKLLRQNHTQIDIPLFGPLPTLERLTQMGEETGQINWMGRIDAKKLSRTHGTELGAIQSDGHFRKAAVGETTLIIDDVVDGQLTLQTMVSDITGIPSSELVDADNLVSVMERYDIFLGVLTVKNEKMWAAIRSATAPQKNRWQQIQQELLEGVALAPGKWLLGSGLDMTVDGASLDIPIDQKNPLTKDVKHIQISIGRSIPGLVGLTNNAEIHRFAREYYTKRITAATNL